VLQELKFEMSLDLGNEPAEASYTIRDAFGKDLEQLSVAHPKGQGPRFEYASGNPLSASEPPDLFECIQGTDISWTDLTLSFLWWKDGTVVGTDTVRGRLCYLLDIPAPPDRKGTAAHNGPDGPHAKRRYSRVLLWIDQQLHMLLRAEGYDSNGELVRGLWVKSFKKINERWMIKDMEIQGGRAYRRTRLRIREVSVDI